MIASRRAAALVLLAALTACRARDTAVLRFVTLDPVAGLDPHFVTDAHSVTVLANVYEPLAYIGAEGALQPGLAVAWSNPADDRWRFELRPGVRFHDGRPLRARDAAYSLNRARREPSVWRQEMVEVAQAWAVGDSVLEVQTRGPAPILLHRLARVGVVPEGTAAIGSAAQAAGTGPYRVESFHAGRELAVARFEGHWARRPRWPRVTFSSLRDAAERVRAVRDGDADLADLPAPHQLDDLARDPRVRVLRHPAPRVGILGFLLTAEGGPFAEPAVREAMDLALDRPALVNEALAGWARPAGHLAPRGVFGSLEKDDVPARNLEGARQAMARSSRPRGFPGSLVLDVMNTRVGEAIRAQMRTLGIELQLSPMPWEAMDRALQARRLPLYVFHMSFPSLEAGMLLETSFHSPDPARGVSLYNFSGLRDPALDALILRSSREMDPQERLHLVREALRRAEASRAWLPLYVRENLWIARPGLRWEAGLDSRIDLEAIVDEAGR
jgi:peptide/nickel transport system substrate-binding protein